MNWSDILKSLDSEFSRLEAEKEKQLKEDEKLANMVLEKSTYEQMLEEDPDGMAQAEKELDEELRLVDRKKILTIVKGSSVTEFNQNWKEKVEAS